MDSKNNLQSILKDYKILSKVGEGTYGEVFKAVTLKTEEGELPQLVALKKHNVLPGEEGVSYCTLQELKYLKAVQGCNNVLQLQDTFIVEEKRDNKMIKSMVMVTPYYSNDLTGAMKQLKDLSHIKCVFKQILQGLQQIHERGLMHRDIKAANILLNEGTVVLGDLGMMTAFIREQPTNFPSNVITLWYRPPELLMGNEQYGAEVDMWSVGCVFVELLTGLALFPGHDEREQFNLIFQRLGCPSRSLSEWMTSLDSHNVHKWTEHIKCAQYPQFSSLRALLQRATMNCAMSSASLNSAADLVERLLTSPQKRLTAADALKHPFFTQSPAPCTPSQIPRLVSSHEYELKMERHREVYSSSSSSSSNSAGNTLVNITKPIVAAHAHQPHSNHQQQKPSSSQQQHLQPARCGMNYQNRPVSHAQRSSPYQRSSSHSPSTSSSSSHRNNNTNNSSSSHRNTTTNNSNTNNNTSSNNGSNNNSNGHSSTNNHLTHHSSLRQQSVVQ